MREEKQKARLQEEYTRYAAGVKGHWCDHKNIPIRPLFTDSNKLTPAGRVLPRVILRREDNFPTEILQLHIGWREIR